MKRCWIHLPESVVVHSLNVVDLCLVQSGSIGMHILFFCLFDIYIKHTNGKGCCNCAPYKWSIILFVQMLRCLLLYHSYKQISIMRC
jgi:hypothetical protein